MNNKNFYDEFFTLNNFIKLGYMDFQPTKNFNNINSSQSGRVDVIYYDFFNFDDLVKKDNMSYINEIDLKPVDTEPIIFTIPKNNNIRRTMKYPNLYSYIILAKFLIDNKQKIIRHLKKDINSTSRFFNRKPYSYDKTESIKEKILFGHLYFLKTDLSSFFHTVYTHSIPWIMLGKEEAKNNRTNELFPNKLDSLIRHEQYGETHGIPTGNILTRVIMELYMSFFDNELKNELPNDVSFHRYVDDFIFAYNKTNSKNIILTKMRKLTSKYELILNDSKTENISYYDIQNHSSLLDFFNNYNDITTYNYKKIKHLINNYIKIGIDEIKSGKKGSNKLIFTGIRYWFKRNKNKKEILLSITTTEEYNTEASIIEKLTQLVLIDTRLTIYYLQLIDEFKKYENKNDTKIFSKCLEGIIKQFKDNCENIIINSVILNEHQTVYSLLLLMNKSGLRLSKNFINKFLDTIINNDSEVDDFSMELLLKDILNLHKKDLIIVVSKIDKIMRSCTDLTKDPFVQRHWLFRYELLNQYDKNDDFRQAVLSYYRLFKINNGNRVLDLENIRNCWIRGKKIPMVKKGNSKKLRPAEKDVLIFYNELLKRNIKFNSLLPNYDIIN